MKVISAYLKRKKKLIFADEMEKIQEGMLKDPSNLLALLYQRSNALSGHGLCIPLAGGVFWSKGWAACRWCHARHSTTPVKMHKFRMVRAGVVRSGWACVEEPPEVS